MNVFVDLKILHLVPNRHGKPELKHPTVTPPLSINNMIEERCQRINCIVHCPECLSGSGVTL